MQKAKEKKQTEQVEKIAQEHPGDFEAYSYRTSSRFGSRVQVSLQDGAVSIAGPRLSVFIYRLWIAGQLLLLFLAVLSLIGALSMRDWRYLVLVIALIIPHLAFSGGGAGCLWEIANLEAFCEGKYPMTSFPLSAIKNIIIGRGWARKGIWLVILPYVAGINQMAKGYAVSFEAPDDQTGKDVVYALHMQTPEEAQELADLLETKA